MHKRLRGGGVIRAHPLAVAVTSTQRMQSAAAHSTPSLAGAQGALTWGPTTEAHVPQTQHQPAQAGGPGEIMCCHQGSSTTLCVCV